MRILNFITSRTRQRIIPVHILLNISRNKDDHTIKIDQLIKYNMRNIFLQTSAQNEARRLVPDLFWFFKKALDKNRWGAP